MTHRTEEWYAAHQKRVKTPRQLRESIQDIEKVFQGMKTKPKKAPTIAQKRRGSVGERIPTEHEEQSEVIKWWAGYAAQHKIPENLLFAIPNGSHKSMASAAKFKREGLRKGTSDLCLAIARKNYHGMYVELKRTKGAYVSDDQEEFGRLVTNEGYNFWVCYGAEHAIRVIKEYLDVG